MQFLAPNYFMMRILIILASFYCTKLLAQQDLYRHSLWVNFEVNQSLNKKQSETIRNINLAPSFSTSLEYNRLLSKKTKLYAVSYLKYRRQLYAADYYFTPHLFMNRTDVDLGRWVDFKVYKNLNTISLGVGGLYKIQTKLKKVSFWTSATTEFHYLMFKTSEANRGKSTISLDYMGTNYTGFMSEGNYYFGGNTIRLAGNFQLGLEVLKKNHPIKLSVGYTFGGILGIVAYKSYSYTGLTIGHTEDIERIESLNISIGVKF